MIISIQHLCFTLEILLGSHAFGNVFSEQNQAANNTFTLPPRLYLPAQMLFCSVGMDNYVMVTPDGFTCKALAVNLLPVFGRVRKDFKVGATGNILGDAITRLPPVRDGDVAQIAVQNGYGRRCATH